MDSVLRAVFCLAVVASVSWVVWQIRLSPLSRFPGPKLWAVTQLPWHVHNIKGRLVFRLHDLHARYGPIVRIGPNELSIAATTLDQWKLIYAHRPHEMAKNLAGTGLPPPHQGIASIDCAGTQEHARMRKSLLPAFSEKAVREQEECVRRYADAFVGGLRRAAQAGPVDMVKHFEWLTFDIVGELLFGKPFGVLSGQQDDPWIATIFDNIEAIAVLQLLLHYRLMPLVEVLMPSSMRQARANHFELPEKRLKQRLLLRTEKPDYVNYIMSSLGSDISTVELGRTASTLAFAGGETSSSVLSASLFYLLTNPEMFEKLQGEIRTEFGDASEVTASRAARLQYLSCVIQETLRLYPPAPATIPRVVPRGGESLDGKWMPEGTVVGIHPYSTNLSSENFAHPQAFVPERWLPEGRRPEAYDADRRAATQPFSYGKRSCIGQSFAQAEMRIVLCRLVVEFDMSLVERSSNWRDQRAFLIWDKKPLMVNLHDRS